jgi:hypothetical protein
MVSHLRARSFAFGVLLRLLRSVSHYPCMHCLTLY